MLENQYSFSKYHKSIVFPPILLKGQLMLLFKRIKARALKRGEIKVCKLCLAPRYLVLIEASLDGSLKDSSPEKLSHGAGH